MEIIIKASHTTPELAHSSIVPAFDGGGISRTKQRGIGGLTGAEPPPSANSCVIVDPTPFRVSPFFSNPEAVRT
ncbi:MULTISPECIES: hypothetical protein [Mesorhizobium]|uniref:hypothetical protein n=1 Tax=Mesorhizobium TaxID=68287 RepID=UPI0010A94F46|nr:MULTISPECIES: hypothetical protein [Mesorhizobium]